MRMLNPALQDANRRRLQCGGANLSCFVRPIMNLLLNRRPIAKQSANENQTQNQRHENQHPRKDGPIIILA